MRCQHGTAFTHGSLSAPSALYREAFFTIQLLELLVVHDAPFACQHDANTPPTKPSAVGRDLTHALAYLGTFRATAAANSFGIDAYQATSSPLGDVVL
jgi:hypothetical protein